MKNQIISNNNKIECSLPEHQDSKAISYCQECKIYMCNKCDKIHSGLCLKHHKYNLEKEIKEIFTGFCKEEKHSNILEYYCKTHNILCCAACISKIKGRGNGQHTDCNVCFIEEIKEEKSAHRGLEILFTVAEEAYCVGASAFEYDRIESDRAYILDRAGEIGSVTVTEPTLISFEVEVRGRASHAGFDPEKGINAIVIASKAIATLPVGRKDEDTTLAIGIIEGGIATNIVPDTVKIRGEIRSQVHEKATETLDEVREAFRLQSEACGGASELKYDTHLKAYSIPEDSPALTEYRKVLKDSGIVFAPEKSFGGSDCNILRQKGIDGVTIANAMWNIHTVSEYTSLDGMAAVTGIIRKLMAI